ncbi:HAMP domain-containing sensor histidine kinase [Nocardia australiensis]|uniref:HAMP domain-containing sensor histidine kinase n=1 Tax=Nocardia australiensis TaxID=2887191 RepID=UPI00272E20A3|nr:ATP-binding protein [Nocardia australiensis]
MIRAWPIRIRLTVAFTIMMALVLAGVGAVTVSHMRSFLDNSVTESLTYQLTELRPLAAAVEPILPGPSQDTAVQILTDSGQVVATTPELSGASALSPAELNSARHATLVVDHAAAGQLTGPVRLAATSAPGNRIVVAAVSLGDRDAAVADLTHELAVGFPLVLLAAALGAYLLAMAALRPVERMRARTAGITHTDPEARLPIPPAHDEISRLGTTFNDLLVRLHEALDRERQFVADAGHELRTPLSLLTTELELALRRPRSNAELTTSLRSALDEVERLSRLSRAMLAATADEPRDPNTPVAVVELRPALESVITRYHATMDETAVTLDCPAALRTRADPDDLDRMITNLLDNATQHGAPPVTIHVRCDADSLVVEVRDHGPGIEPRFLPHIFDRFTRADTARTTGGSGLGLAIVTTLAHRNNGTITATNHPDRGAVFTLTLPADRS